jgi:hypothetical protein
MFFRASALALALSLSASAQSSTQSSASTVAPAEPTNVDAFKKSQLNVVRNGNEVILTWVLPSPTVRQFEIFRNTRDQAPGRVRVGSVRPEPAVFHDVLPDDSATYWYWLKITLISGETVNVGAAPTPGGKVWTP